MTPEQFADVIRFARLTPGWPTVLRGYSLVLTNRAIARRLARSGWRAIAAADGVVLLRRHAPAG
jgi:hypothetical protein